MASSVLKGIAEKKENPHLDLLTHATSTKIW